jgi:hypothetical protein
MNGPSLHGNPLSEETAMDQARLMLLLTLVMLLLVSCAQLPAKPNAQPFKVAFIADTGYDPHDTPALDSGFEQVLDLVRSEEAQLLAIAGDFSYEEETDVARVYFSTINRILR